MRAIGPVQPGVTQGCALAVIDAEGVLKIAKLAIRLPVVAQGRPARLDRLGQHLADQRHQAATAGRADAARLAPGLMPARNSTSQT